MRQKIIRNHFKKFIDRNQYICEGKEEIVFVNEEDNHLAMVISLEEQ